MLRQLHALGVAPRVAQADRALVRTAVRNTNANVALPKVPWSKVFAAILDATRGGSFQIAPSAPHSSEQRYLPATAVLVTGIWLVTSLISGDLLYPWPIWVVGPWGAVLLAQTLAEGRGGSDGPRQLPS